MEREVRYLVIKRRDIHAALTRTELTILFSLSRKVDAWRNEKGKLALDCVVVESDWPEYEPTWAAIEKRMDEAGKHPDCVAEGCYNKIHHGYICKSTCEKLKEF